MGEVAKRTAEGRKAGARALADPGTVAYSEAKDAVSCGLVRDAEEEAESILTAKPPARRPRGPFPTRSGATRSMRTPATTPPTTQEGSQASQPKGTATSAPSIAAA